MFIQAIRTAFTMVLIWSVLTGVLYPLLVTGIAQTLLPFQANGSILTNDQAIPLGSRLIGQLFDDPSYFWGRPSATGFLPNNALASAGSNLGPLNPTLADAVNARIQVLRDSDPKNTLPIPVDLVTASGSGLDPEISLAAANYQIPRIAKARHLKPEVIADLLERHQVSKQPFLWNEPRVNVLELNLALDRLKTS